MTQAPTARGLLQSAARYGVGTTVYKLHVLLLLPIFVYAYDETEVGRLELALFLGGLAVSLATFNLQSVVSHRYAAARPDERSVAAARGFMSMLVMTAVALVASIGIVTARSFIVGEIGDRAWLLAAILAGSSLSALSGNCCVLFQLRSKPGWFNRLYLSWALIVLVGTGLSAVFVAPRAEGYAVSTVAAGLVSLVLAFAGLRSELTEMRAEENWLAELRGTVASDLRWGTRLMPLMLLGWMLLTLDRKILSSAAGLDEVGIYGAAVRVSNAVTVVLGPIQVAWWDIAMNSPEREVPGFLRRVLTLQGLATLIFVVGAVIAGQGPIPQLLGDWFQPGVRYVPVLVVCATLLSGYVIPSAVLTRQGRFGAMTAAYAIAVVINVSLNLLLDERFGAAGATAANLVSYFALTSLTWIPAWPVLREAVQGVRVRVAGPYVAAIVISVAVLVWPSALLTGT